MKNLFIYFSEKDRILLLLLLSSGIIILLLSFMLIGDNMYGKNSDAFVVSKDIVSKPTDSSNNSCGKKCLSNAECGGLTCGKICTNSKCFKDQYCHNPRCPEYTFVGGYTRFTDTIEIPKNITRDPRHEAEKNYCEGLSIKGNSKKFIIDNEKGNVFEDDADKKCQQYGIDNNLPYCDLDYYNLGFEPKSYSCTCREIPFEKTKECGFDADSFSCKCLRNRTMNDEGATSCNQCGGFGKIPVCTSNTLLSEQTTEIEYDESEKTNPFVMNSSNPNCANHIKRIKCSDGRILEDLYSTCDFGGVLNKETQVCEGGMLNWVEGTRELLDVPGDLPDEASKTSWCVAQGSNKGAVCQFLPISGKCSCYLPAPTPTDHNTNPLYSRSCVDKIHWEDLAKTFCNAPYLEKKQCLRININARDKSICDKVCGSLYGKQCENGVGGPSDDYYFKCCPDNIELDSLWSYNFFKYIDSGTHIKLKAGWFQECPKGERIEITPVMSFPTKAFPTTIMNQSIDGRL